MHGYPYEPEPGMIVVFPVGVVLFDDETWGRVDALL
jgi:hypothetical protein